MEDIATMKRNTIIALVLTVSCVGLAIGLINNSNNQVQTKPTPATYMDSHVSYIKVLIQKGEYYKVDQKLLSEVKKIDFSTKEISKKSTNSLNVLEDAISEAEDKLRLAIYAKTHNAQEQKLAQELFTKAWAMNKQMHLAIKEGNQDKIQEIQSKFSELETPLAAEVMKIEIPEPKITEPKL